MGKWAIAPSGVVREDMPEFSPDDILDCLSSAKKTLDANTAEWMRREIMWALFRYISGYGVTKSLTAETPSQAIARLKSVKSASQKLYDLLEEHWRRDELGGYSLVHLALAKAIDDSEKEFLERNESVLAKIESETGKTYEPKLSGSEQIAEIVNYLELLLDESDRATNLIKTWNKGKPRHVGDPHMPELFEAMADIWYGAFGEYPGAGYDQHKGKADGPFVRFMTSVLKMAIERLPPQVVSRRATIVRDLDLTPVAIRDRVQALPQDKRKSKKKT